MAERHLKFGYDLWYPIFRFPYHVVVPISRASCSVVVEARCYKSEGSKPDEVF
jgi:hypothetical protein